jgi:hypothetical protein
MLEKTKGAIKNEESRYTGSIGHKTQNRIQYSILKL